MKSLVFIFSFFIFCLFAPISNLQAQADSRANEIAKQLKITDSQISGRIKQACEEYYKKLDEAEKQADETQRSIKKLRANQNYAVKVKSVLTPEQKLAFDKFNKKEQDAFVKKPATKSNASTTKPTKPTKKQAKKQPKPKTKKGAKSKKD
jgi:predicted Holliday junction resolvase-like endonuclease